MYERLQSRMTTYVQKTYRTAPATADVSKGKVTAREEEQGGDSFSLYHVYIYPLQK